MKGSEVVGSSTALESRLRVEKPGNRVRVVVMHHEAQRNKLSKALIGEFREALEEIRVDSAARVVILTGTGKAFSAGADLRLLQSLSESEAREYLGSIVELFQLIDEYDKPTIAAVNGFAMGGGMELALASDFRVLSEEAVCGLPEVQLGIVPGAGGVNRLSHFVGRGKALEIALTGRPLTASEILALGLAFKVCPGKQLMEEALILAEKLAGMSSNAVRYIKNIVRQAATISAQTAQEAGLEAMVACSQTPQFKNSVEVFIRNRKS